MAHWGNRWVPQRLNRGGQRGFKIGSLLFFFQIELLHYNKIHTHLGGGGILSKPAAGRTTPLLARARLGIR